MRRYEAQIIIFDKDLRPFKVLAEGTRTNIVNVISEIMAKNEEANNIQVIIREK